MNTAERRDVLGCSSLMPDAHEISQGLGDLKGRGKSRGRRGVQPNSSRHLLFGHSLLINTSPGMYHQYIPIVQVVLAMLNQYFPGNIESMGYTIPPTSWTLGMNIVQPNASILSAVHGIRTTDTIS